MGRTLLLDDYSEGAHPEILEAIAVANAGQELGYGEDSYCIRAAEAIRVAFGAPEAAVHFVTGGTQANLTILGALLRPHEGVIAAMTAHINVHETGAVEATGHRIMAAVTPGSKLTASAIAQAAAQHQDEHTVKPGAIFISQATETGEVYTAAELDAVVASARSLGIPVVMDGARLAMATAAGAGAPSLADLGSAGIDVFSVGGTKNGGLFGEAIVITNPVLAQDFRYHLKQRGALLAKGRALGAQFARFFAPDMLWLALAKHADEMARRLADGAASAGHTPVTPASSNQVFLRLTVAEADRLAHDWGFHRWGAPEDGSIVIRLVCSWATSPETVDRFLHDLRGS